MLVGGVQQMGWAGAGDAELRPERVSWPPPARSPSSSTKPLQGRAANMNAPKTTRPPAGADQVRKLMRRLGSAVRSPGRIYLVGGSSAVLVGWRETTVDVDLKLDPEPAGAFEAIARAKETLNINVELAAPDGGLIRAAQLLELFEAIEPALIRYPALDPASFRERVLRAADRIGP